MNGGSSLKVTGSNTTKGNVSRNAKQKRKKELRIQGKRKLNLFLLVLNRCPLTIVHQKKKEKEGFWRQNLYHRFRDEKIK